MKTVNSLSGGKTSSYIAANYPADYEIFALCCIDSHNAGKNIDRKIKQKVNDKLQKYCSHQPEFVATTEDPQVLKTMFDLEQFTGREIIWLRDIGWEQMIQLKQAIPNTQKRFCTTILKMKPIFEFLYLRENLPVTMRIGYRHDEQHRKKTASNTFKYAYKCQYREKSNKWIKRWNKIFWRYNEFPLINNRINHHQVKKFWKNKNIKFPPDSNCLNCFWKQPQQLRKNFDTDNAIMQWSKIMEDLQENRFHNKLNMHQTEKLALQSNFVFSTGSGCQAGFCTD
jgi:hypothetical protein